MSPPVLDPGPARPLSRVRIEGAKVLLALGAEEFATEYSFNPGTAHEIGMQLSAAAEAIMNAGRTAVWTGVVLGVRVAVLDNGERVVDAADVERLFLDADFADKFPAALAAAWPDDTSTAETLPAPPEASTPAPTRPCGSCHRGRRYAPTDALNDDEGYMCPACNGTGLAPEAP